MEEFKLAEEAKLAIKLEEMRRIAREAQKEVCFGWLFCISNSVRRHKCLITLMLMLAGRENGKRSS